MGFYMNHNKEAKSLTFRRGSEVSQGETALSGASSEGHVEVVRLLLPTMDVQFCATALINASSAGHVEVVRLLLQSSADVDCQHSETALSAASSEGHVDVARLLLEACAGKNPILIIEAPIS